MKMRVFIASVLLLAAVLLALSVPTRAESTEAPPIIEFSVPFVNGGPNGITKGPDGNLWFTMCLDDRVGFITTNGSVHEFPAMTSNSCPGHITTGPDGNLWFTEAPSRKIGRITTAGVITEFPLPNGPYGPMPEFITTGPDGNLWFGLYGGFVGKITTSGSITEFPLPAGNPVGSASFGITVGPDNNLWFTEYANQSKIGRITVDGALTEFDIPTANSGPYGIATGPDGKLWFTESAGNKIGQVTTSGLFTEFAIPSTNPYPLSIVSGPDGNLWFVGLNSGLVRVTTAGIFSEFALDSRFTPGDITVGPDNNIWFTEMNGKIGKVVLSTGGTVLNVPLFKQGSAPFNDNNPPWEGNELDDLKSLKPPAWCGTTIAQCGCAVTSIAMVLAYYGVPNPVDGSSTTPATVNNYFKGPPRSCTSSGCATLGFTYGDVVWSAVNNYSQTANAKYGTAKIIYDGDGGYTSQLVSQEISSGRPVILWKINAGHFFVATGISGNTFTINDPFFNRTLLSDPTYGNSADQVRKYLLTHSDFSVIEVKARAPSQVLITDPNGNQTGFNPATSSVVQGVPNSDYFFDQALTDDTGVNPPPPSGVGVYTAIIRTPQSGSYTIQVIAPTNQAYTFAVYADDRNAGVSVNRFDGQAATGTLPDYNFTYDSTPGTTTLALQVPIDIKPGEDPPAINPKSKGVTPVAILSTSTFDATKVDPTSVRFGPAGATAVHNSIEDVNGDGLPDLMLQFRTSQTGIVSGNTQACLTGNTTSGLNIQGCDTIRTVP